MSDQLSGGDINAVLRLVCSLSDDGDAQLTILTWALSVACRSCGVSKERAIWALSECFDLDPPIYSLDSWQTARN